MKLTESKLKATILYPYNVMANLLYNNYLFTHLAETEQQQHSFGVVFFSTSRTLFIYSLFILVSTNSWEKYPNIYAF